MPILRREDGLQFIVHPYREVLRKARTGILKKRIRMLAKEHGSNLRVFKTFDDKIEIVLSRDAGFLLGESIWIYLNKPNNLIYCESLFERNHALMVVVRNGIVLVDAKIPYSAVVDELASLGGITNEKYDIYTYGDVPLGKTKEFGADYFVFEEKDIASFTILEEPLMAKLPVYETVQLQPLELALSSPYLGKSRFIPIVIGAAVIVTTIIGWNIYNHLVRLPAIEKKMAVPKKVEDPYRGYYSALSSPSPREQLFEFVSIAAIIKSLPSGWEVQKIFFDGDEYSMDISYKGGSIALLREWMKMHKMNFVFSTDKIPIKIESTLKKRAQPNAIYPVQDILILLIDETNLLLKNYGKANFIAIDNRGNYKEGAVTIHIEQAIAGILFLIGNEINKLPIAISSIDMTISNNLFSGDIKLKVFGD